ncbi:MAG: class II fumarate hydratase [Phycisphaeraceae bacterium]|nr:class II fumarate hydratase [Phycisphaerales bacterium]MCB9860766.1 class II fumarate hydratase [Phycisphaeraceae bacterium]
MGTMEVPADLLYGASTQRAVLNFPVSGRPVPEQVIQAYALLKSMCAQANEELDLLDAQRSKAIQTACDAIKHGLPQHGGLMRHFPVDIFQTGSGTSTNMNVNEVVSNLVCIARGKPIGSSKDAEYLKAGGVHPNDHVNMGQSSNDTFPTAMHIAAALSIANELIPAIDKITQSLDRKAKSFDEIVKIGRTHLQDATPIRLGQEFAGYTSQMQHARVRLERALAALGELALGGTAVGTGINTHGKFGSLVAKKLAAHTGVQFREAEDHCEAQHAKDAIVETSGMLRTVAVSLSKIANDIRWMGCGPRCGIGELKLPAVQPGSSIMPGKVNPVLCESVMMVCCQVIGNDAAVTMGGLGGIGSILDLNVAMPVMAANVLDSIHLLSRACHVFVDNLLDGPEGSGGLQADVDRCKELIEGSLAMCTSLVPAIGYDQSAALAKRAYKEGKTVRELARELGVLSNEELDRLLDPMSMTKPVA